MGSKQESFNTTVEAAITDGYVRLQEIRDDLSNTIDAMEERMSNTSRYANYEEIRDALDSNVDEVPDVSGAVGGLKMAYVNDTRARESSTYAVRLDNAIAMLSGALATIDDWLEENSDEDEEDETDEDEGFVEVTEFRETLEGVIDELGGLSFG